MVLRITLTDQYRPCCLSSLCAVRFIQFLLCQPHKKPNKKKTSFFFFFDFLNISISWRIVRRWVFFFLLSLCFVFVFIYLFIIFVLLSCVLVCLLRKMMENIKKVMDSRSICFMFFWVWKGY